MLLTCFFLCVCCFMCKHWGDWGTREAILASFLSQVSPMRGADQMLTMRKLYLTVPVVIFLTSKASKESHHRKEQMNGNGNSDGTGNY